MEQEIEYRIYDVSAMINAGTKASHSKTYNINGIPTGGLYKVLGYIVFDALFDKNIKIVACMDSRTSTLLRREILPAYKSNRGLGGSKQSEELNELLRRLAEATNTQDIYNEIVLSEYQKLPPKDQEKIALASNVSVQMRIISDIFDKLGITVLRKEGYEADDFIYSCVFSTLKERPPIVIRADDSDLLDCYKFNHRTKFVSVAARGDLKGTTTTLLTKMFKGDRSDNIPNLVKKYPTECAYVERLIIDGKVDPFKVRIKNKFNEDFLKDLDINPIARDEIVKNIYCVSPFKFNVAELMKSSTVDLDVLYDILCTFRMKTLSKKLGKPLPERLSEESMDKLYEIKRQIPIYTEKFFGSKLYNI